MRITTQGEYGLRCMLNIAKHSKEPISISELARCERLPKDYVEQLLLKLRRAKIIKSIRGLNGGYVLAKNPNTVSIADILKALEGDTFEIICDKYRGKAHLKRCVRFDKRCDLRPVWKKLKAQIDATLGKAKLTSLLRQTYLTKL